MNIIQNLKTKKMCKHPVKMLPFLIKYVPGRFKTQKMRYKVILKNGGMLMVFPDCYRDQNMWNKAEIYPRLL